MCIICTGEYDKNIIRLDCPDCPLLTSIPSLPNLTHLDCSECPLLTSIPSLPNLIWLNCPECPLLTSIPSLPNLNKLNCSNCPLLTSIPSLPNLNKLDCYSCKWLNVTLKNLNNLILIQRRFHQMLKYFRFVRFIKSREFNEWFYAPDGIGGKYHKIQMEKFLIP